MIDATVDAGRRYAGYQLTAAPGDGWPPAEPAEPADAGVEHDGGGQ